MNIDARPQVSRIYASARLQRPIAGRVRFAALLLAALLAMPPPPTHAAPQDTKPYDSKLLRLTEILGAVHYLRELCGAGDGQQWRDRMKDLLDSEGTSALRRAKFTQSFNKGYRSYSRTYKTCTPSAKTTISKFLVEGVEISDGLIKNVP